MKKRNHFEKKQKVFGDWWREKGKTLEWERKVK